MIVYLTTNKINGKPYVGQDSKNNPEYFGSGKLIQMAVKKYGKENFEKTTLRECKTKKELNEWEIYYIEELKTRSNVEGHYGYNISMGGGSSLGLKLSTESKKKISNVSKELWKNLDYRDKMVVGKSGTENPFYGKKHTIETRKKISKSHTGMIASEESKRKMSNSHSGEKNHFYGKTHTVEAREKIKSANRNRIPWNKGLTKDDDERLRMAGKKISISKKGKNNV